MTLFSQEDERETKSLSIEGRRKLKGKWFFTMGRSAHITLNTGGVIY